MSGGRVILEPTEKRRYEQCPSLDFVLRLVFMKNLCSIFGKKETGSVGGRKEKAGEIKARKRNKDDKLKVNVFIPNTPFQTWPIEDLTSVHS